jgi:Protein of unknown function (DUF2474)
MGRVSLMNDRDLPADREPLIKRLGWMAAIWAGSVLALGAVAWVIRAAIR